MLQKSDRKGNCFSERDSEGISEINMGVLSALGRVCGSVVRAMTPSFLSEVDETDVRSRNDRDKWRKDCDVLPESQNIPHITERTTLFRDTPQPSNQSFQFISQSPKYSGSFQYDSPTQTGKMLRSFDSGFEENGCREESPIGRERFVGTNQHTPQREFLNLEGEKPRGGYIAGKKHVKADVYDGKSRELEEYLAHFNKVSSWNRWSYEEKGEQLSMCLRGTAHIATLHMENPNDYEAIVSVLAHRFSPKEEIASRRSEFRNRKREKGESIGEYGYALRNLVNTAYRGIDQEAQEIFLLEQFIGGLCHSDMQQHVQFKRPVTLNEAMSIAREYEAIRGTGDKWRKPDTRDYRVPVRRVEEDRENRRGREQQKSGDNQRGNSADKCDEDLKSTIKELQQTVHALLEREKKRESEAVKVVKGACYICGDGNHFANRCPRKENNPRNRGGVRDLPGQGRSFVPTNKTQLNH